jgi:hypothetical protein
MRVDAGQIGIEHHLGGDVDQLWVHLPGAKDGDNLFSNAAGGKIHCVSSSGAILTVTFFIPATGHRIS